MAPTVKVAEETAIAAEYYYEVDSGRGCAAAASTLIKLCRARPRPLQPFLSSRMRCGRERSPRLQYSRPAF